MKEAKLQPTPPLSPDHNSQQPSFIRRRSFLQGLGVSGAMLLPASLYADGDNHHRKKLPRGDVAILRFLAAAELIESDLWQQYNELGGVKGGNAAYMAALENLDEDMPQYIADNTDDELSHAAFLNAYLESRGEQPVNLDAFRTLPSSMATGAKQIGRLTNLQNLNVDTSWYTRYRSEENPDFGATFPQAVQIVGEPAIPMNDSDTPPGMTQPADPVTPQQRRMQAIANTAGFHFAFIEQGGSSLYTIMSLKVTNLEVLRIVVSIGGTEVNHFAVWHDKAGNAVHVTDPVTGVVFPDLNSPPFGGEQFQTNLIFPEPCDFLKGERLPPCSVIRPSLDKNGGAVATIKAFTEDGLFMGQSGAFFEAAMELARAADAARRGDGDGD
jgi:hypothetical protein